MEEEKKILKARKRIVTMIARGFDKEVIDAQVLALARLRRELSAAFNKNKT